MKKTILLSLLVMVLFSCNREKIPNIILIMSDDMGGCNQATGAEAEMGVDNGFYGRGDTRQQWITYRDKYCYERIVTMGPHYPLNSLMLGGIIIGDRKTSRSHQHEPPTPRGGSD